MATLYLARRHGAAGFSRLVALKMVHSSLVARAGFIEMFIDEARICARISHPNVVHVEEFGVIDGVHYLVMEYLDGCSLHELLQVFSDERRTLDPELAAAVIAQVAGGLHAAHETRDLDGQPLEIIHRDISPSNVLLSPAGNAKLIDFGIAKARNRLSETQTGIALKGKYKYVAPEQAKGIAVDRRCDVFSLGVVFWELLVGQPLFRDDSAMALFERVRKPGVPAPSAVNPAAPLIFDPIVLAMLHPDPDRRPQTAAEVQRLIVQAAPGAANRDPRELGALAVEVRDLRAAVRATQRAASEIDEERRMSFSPTPRSAESAPRDPMTTVLTSIRWTHRVLVVLAGLLVAAVIAGFWLVRSAGWPGASSTPALKLVEPVVAVDPPPPVLLPEPAPVPAPVPVPVAVEVALPLPTRVIAPVRPRAPSVPARRPPSAPTRPAAIATGKAPLVDAPFDDSEPDAAAPPRPQAVKVRKTPLVPGFDN